MTNRELQHALKQVAAGMSKLSVIIGALREQGSGVPCAPTAELRESFRLLNEELQALAPHMAQAFCCEAAMVKFVKTLVESVGCQPEIRDGGFFIPLGIEEEDLTWDEYFGVDEDEQRVQ